MMFFAWQGRSEQWSKPLWIQVLRCTIFVTACEFITGLIVNKWLRLGVWDYSDQPFQLFGQICLPFALIFSGLSWTLTILPKTAVPTALLTSVFRIIPQELGPQLLRLLMTYGKVRFLFVSDKMGRLRAAPFINLVWVKSNS